MRSQRSSVSNRRSTQQFYFARPGRTHPKQETTAAAAGSRLWCGFPGVAETVVMGSTSADARAPLHDYRLSRDQNQRFITGLAHPVLQPPGTNQDQSNPSSSGVGESCSAASTVAGAELPSVTLDAAPSTVHRRITTQSKSNTKAPPSCLSARLTNLPSSTTTKVPGSLLFDERNSSLQGRNRKEPMLSVAQRVGMEPQETANQVVRQERDLNSTVPRYHFNSSWNSRTFGALYASP